MISRDTRREKVSFNPWRPANVAVFAVTDRSTLLATMLVVGGLFAAITIIVIMLFFHADHLRRKAEANIVQNFYPTAAGHYQRMDIMPEEQMFSVVDRYLKMRYTWTPNTIDYRLSQAEILTHEQLRKGEASRGLIADVKTRARKQESQTTTRLENPSTHPYQYVPTSFGYLVRIFVSQHSSVYGKEYGRTIKSLCLALIQVDPDVSINWGLEVGKSEFGCDPLKY